MCDEYRQSRGHAPGAEEMVPVEIPEEVRRFLTEHIESVPQLEALLLAWETAPRAWNAESLAARIYVSAIIGSGLLEDLARRGILERLPTSPPTFRFDGANEARRALIDKVSECYRTQLVGVAQFIHERASGSVRDFARAFKIKGDEK